MFGLVERFIGAKMLDVSRGHWLGDQHAVEALVRFTDEELKHQEMFRRLELMAASGMPAGYRFVPEANAVASVVLGKSTWAVLALICHIEVFVLAHYRQSIAPDPALSSLFKDVMLHHWREESQHVIVDELEWEREDAALSPSARGAAVDELIELIGAVDGIVQAQAHVRQRRAHFVGGDRCDCADRPAGNALDGIGRRRMRGEIAPDRADQGFVRRRYGDGGFVRHDGGRPNPRVDGVIGIRNITACRTHRTNLTS